MLVNDSEPEIDFDHLNQYVGGDVSITAEVFGMFKHQMEMWGRALNSDADDDTWEAVTHSMKGSALAVGATKLAELCDKAEVLVGDSNRPGARDIAVQNIEFRVSRVIIEIQRWEYRQTIQGIKG